MLRRTARRSPHAILKYRAQLVGGDKGIRSRAEM
jgi:hypothetical protein